MVMLSAIILILLHSEHYTAFRARHFPYHGYTNKLVPNIVNGSKHDGSLRYTLPIND